MEEVKEEDSNTKEAIDGNLGMYNMCDSIANAFIAVA
jgi:hypothetical protein